MNPFSKFAAKPVKQSQIGWLATKKVGRDDEKIANDRRKAEIKRKHLKSAKRSKPKALSKKKSKNKQRYESETEDEESIDEFIVDSDEDIEEYPSSEEEELIIIDSPKKKKSNKSDKKLKTISKQFIPVESSEDEFQLSEKENEMYTEKHKRSSNSFDDDTDSDLGEPVFAPKEKTRTKDTATTFSTVSKINRKFRSPYFTSAEEKKEDKINIQKNQYKSKRSINIENVDADYAEKLALHHAMKDSLKETKSKSVSKRPSKRSRSHLEQYVRSNEDQDMKDAIAASLVESETTEKKRKHQRIFLEDSESDDDNKKHKASYKRSIALEEEESDSENGEDNFEDDEYHNPESREALSVLETTKNLSSRIMSRMSQWCIDTKLEDPKNCSRTSSTTGMIVGGALSYSICKTERHQLLVQREDIEEICRGLKLGDYQLLGVNWLALLNSMQCSIEKEKSKSNQNISHVNGVLADEMGLGKTVQTIAFLAWLKFKEIQKMKKDSHRDEVDDLPINSVHTKPHIIIVPASVLSNWMNEFEKFCPKMRVVKYHGSMSERVEIQQKLRKCLPKSRNRMPLDVVLTTFSYFSSEKSDDRNFLRKFKFDYMVVDEAHCLKNAKGLRYRNMDKFSTSHRLLLTGTPVQNSPKELMSLLCFLMPLFSQKTSNSFDDEKTNNGGEHMLEYFVSMNPNESEETQYRKLKQLLSPFVLRRKKSDVLSQLLPPKTRQVELVPFDEKTQKVYNSIISSHVASRQQNTEKESSFVTKHIFTSLRKAANHPLLLRTRHTSPAAIEHLSRQLMTAGFFGSDATCTLKLVKNELKDFSDFDIHCVALELIEENRHRSKELERYTLQEDDLFCSPKFTRLKSLLPSLVKQNHRILIFSQWTRCLDLLGCLLDSIQFKYLRLDGQTSIPERQTLIDEFNNDLSIPVFLLSTRAGGMGINLTSADTCILHDLDFNPFNDLQAEDRCHRIGQKRPVTVIKMVTKDTVDASIYSMQEKKAKMNAAILESSASSNNQRAKTKGDDIAINTIVADAMTHFLSSTPTKKRA